jgi:hypothetical protein
MSNEDTVSRRGLFMKLGILFNGVVAAALAVPIVRFVLSSVTRGRGNAYLSWVPLGSVSEFPEGETRLATFRNPYVTPTDGKTVDTACWVRRIEGEQFQVFAVNCANLVCSCAHATEACITRTVREPRVRRSAGCLNIRTKCRTVWSLSRRVSCPHRERVRP